MKVRLPRQEFVDALAAVAVVAGGRTTRPILNCVRLVTEGERVELSATDGETALRLGVDTFAVEEAGEAVVPAERLLGVVREMPDAEIRLGADDRYCVVSGAGSEFKMFVMPPADFPAVAEFGDQADLVVDGAQVARMIAWTIYAAARETGRYAINGILWQKRGKKLFLVATDGRRLARAGGSVAEAKVGDFDIIVPVKALHAFERVFAPSREQQGWTVDLRVMPNQVLFRSGERVLGAALVEGTFPRYEDVIPRDADKLATVSRLELYSAVRRAALLTTDEARAVRMAFSPERLVVTAQSPEQGEARVEVPVEYRGAPLEIGFNAVFVNDALKVLPFDTVYLELKESFRPGVLRGEDAGEFLYVVMPIAL